VRGAKAIALVLVIHAVLVCFVKPRGEILSIIDSCIICGLDCIPFRLIS
jgi:hypothetical protein